MSDDLHFRVTATEVAEASIITEEIEKALRVEYARGFKAGAQEAPIDAEQLKAEYQRGRDDYKRELFAKLDDMNPGTFAEMVKAPIANDIEEMPADVRSVAIAKPAPEKSPRPNPSGRPDGLPRNVEMAIEAIKELDGKASSSQILAYIRKKWWAGFSSNWTAQLYEFVNQGKLARDGINFIVAIEPQILPKDPSKALMPAVRPTAGPRIPEPGKKLGPPPRADGVSFQHGDRSVMLHQREATLAVQLRSAMGKGHLDAKFLANSIGIKNEAEMTIREFATIMNPKLEKVGLSIDFYKGFGFSMKELA